MQSNNSHRPVTPRAVKAELAGQRVLVVGMAQVDFDDQVVEVPVEVGQIFKSDEQHMAETIAVGVE